VPPPNDPERAVLNGIAYDVDGGRLFVTGKLWPRLFEIASGSNGGRSAVPGRRAQGLVSSAHPRDRATSVGSLASPFAVNVV
jgi:hypothetical protein